MRICDVIGRVWPETPLTDLGGKALVLIRDLYNRDVFAALDLVGAGTGARVLVACGEPARAISGGAPVDAVVLALVHTDAPASDDTGSPS